MVTPTQNTAQVAATQNVSPAPVSTPPRIGVGAAPSSLAPSPKSDFDFEGLLQKIQHYASSLFSYALSLFAKVKETVLSWLSSLSEEASGPSVGSIGNTEWVILPSQVSTPPAPANDPFDALPLTPTDQRKIHTLIHNMGTLSLPRLFTMQSEMKRIGDDIQNVHPLRFLGYIFQHPQLPNNMETISNNPFKWSPFIQGLAENFNRDASNLPECKIGFARTLNINPADIEPFFASSNWEGMVKFLIEVKTGKRQSEWAPSSPPPVNAAPAPSTTAASTEAASALLSDLTLDPAHLQTLRSIFDTYRKTNTVILKFDDRGLEEQWATLDKCHPLKLLSAIHADEPMKNQIKALRDSYFKGANSSWPSHPSLRNSPRPRSSPTLTTLSGSAAKATQQQNFLSKIRAGSKL